MFLLARFLSDILIARNLLKQAIMGVKDPIGGLEHGVQFVYEVS